MIKPLVTNIVVAISGSDASILAAKYAIVMAKAYHCKLTAVYVVDTATIKQLTLSKVFIQEESQEYESSLEANGERYLSFVEELARAKGVKIEKELRKGAVYSEIVSTAGEKNADLIILARYMQILSPAFIKAYTDRIINVHHSFLPAFKGAKPYHQAYQRGVKIIGATAHFATEDLDQGPIIQQNVAQISHRDTVEDLITRGRDLERQVLAAAVRYFLNDRLFVCGSRTIVL